MPLKQLIAHNHWPLHLVIRVLCFPLLYLIINFVVTALDAETFGGGLPTAFAIEMPLFLLFLIGEAMHLFRKNKLDKLFCNLGMVLSIVFASFFIVTT